MLFAPFSIRRRMRPPVRSKPSLACSHARRAGPTMFAPASVSPRCSTTRAEPVGFIGDSKPSANAREVTDVVDRDRTVTVIRCPNCDSRLDVMETQSGGRIVSVIGLGHSVEQSARALELFLPPGAGPDLTCPACHGRIDTSVPHRRIPPLAKKNDIRS